VLSRSSFHRNIQQVRCFSSIHKQVSAADAVHLIQDNDTITVGGFVAQNAPEELLAALGKRYRETGSPKNLTVVFGGGPGDFDTKGINHLAQPGLIKRAVGSHYGQVPQLAALCQNNEIEAYNLPLGSVSRMIRAAASGLPGHITKIGFGTSSDPAQGGGKINERTTEDLVSEIEINDEKYLLYKAIPINVALIRGTTADTDGNVTMEDESLYVDNMIQAMATHSSAGKPQRGTVIVQVKNVSANSSLHPRQVKVPGTMVDCVVEATPENHTMSYFTKSNPAACGHIRAPEKFQLMPLDKRKIIARRAALELLPNQVVNLGIGMPEGVAVVAGEEKCLDFFSLTTEPGIHGGLGLSGHEFGPALNYSAMLDMNQQFDFYNGSGLDVCFLGMAEVNANGDVNVTRVGNKLTGPGGFVDISQATPRVNLLGTFTAGGLEVEVKDGQVKILREGRIRKFVSDLKEVTFNGDVARNNHQVVNYITERCVFSLTKYGLELMEIAPGIDLERDILAHMDFEPHIGSHLKTMNPDIYNTTLMGLRASSFGLNLAERFHYNAETNTLYVNFAHLSVQSPETIDEIHAYHAKVLAENGITKNHQCHCIVNYDGFNCHHELECDYQAWLQNIEPVTCQ
jgi:propionate CoA-transferase